MGCCVRVCVWAGGVVWCTNIERRAHTYSPANDINYIYMDRSNHQLNLHNRLCGFYERRRCNQRRLHYLPRHPSHHWTAPSSNSVADGFSACALSFPVNHHAMYMICETDVTYMMNVLILCKCPIQKKNKQIIDVICFVPVALSQP